jgi:hypothetical protein
MAQNKKHITPENITEWLASTGFLFPRNEIELARFEELYSNEDFALIGNEIDPDKILNSEKQKITVTKQLPIELNEHVIKEYRMVARNGSKLPKHILDKIKKNQDNSKGNDKSTTEESNH